MPRAKKTARRKARFKLVPKAATLRMLKALNLKVVVKGPNVDIVKVPQGGMCFVFAPPCRLASYFKKVSLD